MKICLLGCALAGGSVPAVAGKNCTCRAGGHDYQLGDVICIRGHLSQCQMNQNVTSWKEIADECPRVERPVTLAQSLPRQSALLSD